MDTHAFVWVVRDSDRMPEEIKDLLRAAHRVLVSLVALWEIVIKESTRRPMVGTSNAGGWFLQMMDDTGFDLLDIRALHVGAVQSLPLHHGDPFDRLLVAQAMTEQVPIVSGDSVLKRYEEIEVIWAS